MKKFRDFESAREFARSLGLKNQKEWYEYCKSGNKPDDIPVAVEQTYKKDFKGTGDWLGTGNVKPGDKVFRSFTQAREFARELKLKTQREWREYCKSGDKPDDIPASPNKTYKKDYKGMGDWLGTGNVKPEDKVFRSFTQAREFVRSLGLKTGEEWTEYCKSGDKPDDIPASPYQTYKKDCKGMGDWLGTGNVADKDRIFRPYKEAREFARELKLKTQREWREYCKSGDKPDDIPASPYQTYKKDCKGMGDWLGTGKTREWKTFNEAREFVRSLNLKGEKEWREYCKSGNKPDYIPSAPWGNYKKEWKGWGDFLGHGRVHNKDKVFRSFTQAREFARKLGLKNYNEWQTYCNSGNKPDDIPSAPWKVYTEWKKK
jgi:hypothetical protein